jgi:SH3-like domain-containing protein
MRSSRLAVLAFGFLGLGLVGPGGLLLPIATPVALADEPGPSPAPGPALEASWTVGLVRGDQVNLRIGPRQDDQAVMTVDQGTVVIVVERVGDWLGIRLPAGFSGAVAAALTEPIDSEHVRVTGANVNLRRGAGLEQPAFRDRLERGTVLAVMAREGDWLMVEAPEEVRAYVYAAYVEDKGPVGSNGERIEEGRKRRAAREALRAQTTKRTAAEGDDRALRDELAAAAKALADLRTAGGYDVAPVAAVEDRLDAAITARAGALPRTKALANVLLEDLRREGQIRVAFADEIVAKKRMGQAVPERPKAPAEAIPALEVVGTLRWEPAPGWDGREAVARGPLGRRRPQGVRGQEGARARHPGRHPRHRPAARGRRVGRRCPVARRERARRLDRADRRGAAQRAGFAFARSMRSRRLNASPWATS